MSVLDTLLIGTYFLTIAWSVFIGWCLCLLNEARLDRKFDIEARLNEIGEDDWPSDDARIASMYF